MLTHHFISDGRNIKSIVGLVLALGLVTPQPTHQVGSRRFSHLRGGHGRRRQVLGLQCRWSTGKWHGDQQPHAGGCLRR